MTTDEHEVPTKNDAEQREIESLLTRLEEELVHRMLKSIRNRQADFKMRDPNASLVVLMHPKDAWLIKCSNYWRYSGHEFKLFGMSVFQTDSAPINDPRVAKLNV